MKKQYNDKIQCISNGITTILTEEQTLMYYQIRKGMRANLRKRKIKKIFNGK